MFSLIDRWTANIRISRKLLIAPAVAIVLLSLMAPLALKSLGDQTQLIERLTTTEVEKSMTIAALERAIPEASGELNRIMALASNSDDDAGVKRLTAGMNKRLGEAAALIAQLAGSELSEREKQVVGDLGKALTAYTQSSGSVIAMVAGDVPTAYMMSRNGEKSYGELLARLDDLLAIERTQAASAHETSMASAQTVRYGFIVLFAVATVIAILVSVAISGAIGGSIVRLTASTIRLADGDVGVTVEGSGRKDEIGALAGALGTFKHERDREGAHRGGAARPAGAGGRTPGADRGPYPRVRRDHAQRARDGRRGGDAAQGHRRDDGQHGQETASERGIGRFGSGLGKRFDRRRRDRGAVGLDQRDQHQVRRSSTDRLRERSSAHQRRRCKAWRMRAEDRRRRPADPGHRVADQPAGAQRDHRGGARRRGRQGLCRGRLRGQEARQPDRQGDRGDLGADRRHAVLTDEAVAAIASISETIGRSTRSPARSRRRSSSRARPRRRSRATPRGGDRHRRGLAQYHRRQFGGRESGKSGRGRACLLDPARRPGAEPARQMDRSSPIFAPLDPYPFVLYA